MEQLINQGGTPKFPELEEVSYMVTWWQEVGLSGVGAMSAAPLQPSELMAWSAGRQIALAAWEFQTLLDMSREYVSWLHKGEDVSCVAPFAVEADQNDRDVVARKVAAAFGSRTKASR